MTFTVSSNSFKDGDYLPSDFILSADFGFGCAGGNRSPHLKWSGVPEGTKSGLDDALEKLKGIKGIAQVRLDREDIVRHRLVQNIVNAYERH